MALWVAGCAGGPPPPTLPPVVGPVVLPAELRIRVVDQMVWVPIEEYVIGTALSEVSPVGDTPEDVAGIFRIQAIIARTYAAFHRGRHAHEGFDLCDTTHCQVYQPGRLATSRFSAAARAAVSDTAGQVLVYGQRPAEALFHSDCGGHTAGADVVWGGRVPYLIGTPDDVPAGTHRPWRFALTLDELLAALNGSQPTAVGDRLLGVRVATRDASGRAATMELTGDVIRTVRGEQVRAAVNQRHGALAIRSTKFSLAQDGETLHFTGIGWGHGVGLCQLGAAARIRRGEAVRDILGVYYPGARLVGAS
jgi:stage II sporulation protein D